VLARREVQRQVSPQRDELGVGEHVRLHALPRGPEFRVVGHARGVRQEVAQRDLMSVRRIVGQVIRHRIVGRELAAIRQPQDRGGGELLRDRADPEQRVLVRADREFEVGEAVGLRVRRLLAAHHGDRDPHRARPAHGRLHDGLGA
jgi:hypothetical protein